MSDVLRYRQLAPHGFCLAPVIVISYEYNFLIVIIVWLVRTGCHKIIHRVKLHCFRRLTSCFHGLKICLLHDVHLAEHLLNHQLIHCLAILTNYSFNRNSLIIHCGHRLDICWHLNTIRRLAFYVVIKCRCNICCCHCRTIAPFCIRV